VHWHCTFNSYTVYIGPEKQKVITKYEDFSHFSEKNCQLLRFGTKIFGRVHTVKQCCGAASFLCRSVCTSGNSPQYTESNPSVARYKENTEKIRSILRTSILCLFLGPFAVLPKVGEQTELLRISKEWRGLRFSSYLASTYLRIYKAT
jgi:hypothetical protein